MERPPQDRAGRSGQRSFVRLVALVTVREYLRTIRRRGFLFGTLLLPLVIAGAVGVSILASAALDEGEGRPVIVLVNESRLALRPVASQQLAVAVVDRRAALSGVRDGRWKEFYVVPRGYPAAGEIERVVTPTRGSDIGSLERRAAQQGALAGYLRRAVAAAQGIPEATVERLVQPVVVRDVDPDGRPAPAGFNPAAIVIPTLFTMLFVMSIFITSNYLLQSVTEEKENRVVEIVLSSVPALHLMAGKILGLGAAGLTQVVIWLLTAVIALPLVGTLAATGSVGGGAGGLPGSGGVPGAGGSVDATAFAGPGPGILFLAVVYFVLGYLAYGALFAAIGALAPGTREAQQYSGVFGFVAVIPFILSSVFLADPGSPIVAALVIFPMTAPAAALQVLMLAPEPPWLLVGLSLALLIAFVTVATIASGRVFRATLLLYGTRPSFGQVMGALMGRA